MHWGDIMIPSNIYPLLFAIAFVLTVMEFIIHLPEDEPSTWNWIIFFVVIGALFSFLFAIAYAAGIVLFGLR